MAPAVLPALRPAVAHPTTRPAGHPWPRRSCRPSGRRSLILAPVLVVAAVLWYARTGALSSVCRRPLRLPVRHGAGFLHDRRAVHGPGGLAGPPAGGRSSNYTTGGPSMAPAVLPALRPAVAHPGSRARSRCGVVRPNRRGMGNPQPRWALTRHPAPTACFDIDADLGVCESPTPEIPHATHPLGLVRRCDLHGCMRIELRPGCAA